MGGTLSGFTGSGTSYSAVFTPADGSTAPGTVSIAAGTVTNAAGNVNTSSVLSPAITINTIRPTIVIISTASSLRAGQTATISFALDEASADFTEGDITVSGGVISGFTGLGTSYSATFTPTANSTLPGTVSVASGTFSSGAGNPNRVGSLAHAITIDSLPPSLVGFSSASANGSYGIGQAVTIVANLSERVQAGGAIVATLSTGAIVTLAAVTEGTALSGTYLVAPGAVAADLDVTSYRISPAAPITDLAGNGMTATLPPSPSNSLAAVADIRVAGGIAATAVGFSSDSTSVPDRKVTVSFIPITFNTPVTGLKLSSFRLLLNGRSVSLRGATLALRGSTYVLQIPSWAASSKGIYSLQIAATGIKSTANLAPMTTASIIYWGKGASVTPKTRAFATGL